MGSSKGTSGKSQADKRMKAFLKYYAPYCLLAFLLSLFYDGTSARPATIKPLNVFYVNTNTQWQARAEIKNGHVDRLIFRSGLERPFDSSHNDNNGQGKGIDFRGKVWLFRGFPSL